MSVQCVICNNKRIRNKHPYFSFAVDVCSHCGFIKASITPDRVDLAQYYKQYSYITDLEIDIITQKRYNHLLNQLEFVRKTNKILDYGCGLGHFLEEAKKRNWNIAGYEFSESAISILRDKGIPVCEEIIPESEIGRYDAVICIEVLEHVPDPVSVIDLFSKLLRPGGCLYITVPNIKSISLSYLKNRTFFINYPEHLNYFTVKSLKVLLLRGFVIKNIRTTGLTLQSFMSSSNTLTINEINNCKERIEKVWWLHIIKQIANAFLTLIKRGDTIKIIATKEF